MFHTTMTSVALSAPEPFTCAEVPKQAGEVDAATIAACRRGEPLALRRFVVCYQNTVFAFVSRMLGAGPHVEDIAQEVFLRAYRALPRFEWRHNARVSTWLLRIAVRVVQDSRKRQRMNTIPLADSKPRGHVQTPEVERRRRAIAAAFEKAAAALPQEQRLVFVLAEFHGQSMQQMSDMLGVPTNTVKTRLFRARTRLRELLARTWEEYR